MSGTFPTSPSFITTNFKINNPTQISNTFGGKVRRVGLGSTYYTYTAKFPPMTREEAQPIIAFLSAQYGQLDSFQMYLPMESFPRANYTGSQITTSGTITAGAKTVGVGGTGIANGTVLLRAGDYFKFTGSAWASSVSYAVNALVKLGSVDYQCVTAHTSGLTFDSTKFVPQTKVYMAISDCICGSGGGTLNFSGSAMHTIPTGSKLLLNTVPFTVMLNNDIQEYEVGLGRMYNLSVDLREAI
jgi:hypothetical protein